MQQALLDQLRKITEEERKILDGEAEVDRDLYTSGRDFTVDSRKMLKEGRLIAVRTHTRFVYFPSHRHNFVEVLYVCEGSLTNIIDGKKVIVNKGELLFLNQFTKHEILKAGQNDIAINFMVLPEFFDVAYSMAGNDNMLADFLVNVLRQDEERGEYLHFKVAEVLQIQNLLENIIYSLVNGEENRERINQTTMGLIFMYLVESVQYVEMRLPNQYENMIKVPETIKVVIDGELPENVMSKDIILRLIGDLRADGATYRALEFSGSTIENMSVASRMTMANMAIEAGAKCALFTPDEKTAAYCNVELDDYQKSLVGDADAVYMKTITYKAEDFVPVMACPSQVDKIRDVSELQGETIDQVFIGSCTNGRLEDLMAAAEVLKGKKVADFVKLIVTPASRKIYRQAIELGILDTLAEAGAIITHPGCGLCCGRTGGILTDGEKVVATNNRNFLGRMGTSKVQIYLASPKTAAACAVAGKIVMAE